MDTTKLKDMLDNLINGKQEQAQNVFHTYLKDKIQDVFGGVKDQINKPKDRT
jgi:hypothetical protein